jgi:hypothetical protein
MGGDQGRQMGAFPLSTAERPRVTARSFVSPNIMRLPRWFLWPLLYAVATFGWMVFFEHGPGWERFQAGAKAELTRAWEELRWWTYGKAGL